jgi:hypothetical protein
MVPTWFDLYCGRGRIPIRNGASNLFTLGPVLMIQFSTIGITCPLQSRTLSLASVGQTSCCKFCCGIVQQSTFLAFTFLTVTMSLRSYIPSTLNNQSLRKHLKLFHKSFQINNNILNCLLLFAKINTNCLQARPPPINGWKMKYDSVKYLREDLIVWKKKLWILWWIHLQK